MSTKEIKEMLNHLKLVYETNELLELDNVHLFKILVFSKMSVVSVENTISCLLFVPILNPDPFNYQRIYPLPYNENKLLLPPAKYRLSGIQEELWTNGQRSVIERQILCVNKPQTSYCVLSESNSKNNCNLILARNNYKLFVRVSNNKILAVCKSTFSSFWSLC